MLRQGEDTRSR